VAEGGEGGEFPAAESSAVNCVGFLPDSGPNPTWFGPPERRVGANGLSPPSVMLFGAAPCGARGRTEAAAWRSASSAWRVASPGMETGTARAALDPDGGEHFLSLRRALGVTSFGMNQIVLRPRQRGRIHRHERQEEVYLVLEGTLTLVVEGEEEAVRQGELVRVAPEVRRQLVNRGPERLVLLALGGDGEHQGRDGRAFTSWDDADGAPPAEVPLPDDLPA
jgi:mannose-6-phosphate isomerase-like protein (cupin superfamily)